MTVGQALERAEELRPGCKVDSCTRQRWLCEEDGMLRALLFSGCGLRAGVGADLAWPAEGDLGDISSARLKRSGTRLGFAYARLAKCRRFRGVA